MRSAHSLNLLLQLPQQTISPTQLGPKVPTTQYIPTSTTYAASGVALLLSIRLLSIRIPIGVIASLSLTLAIGLLRVVLRLGLLCVRVAAAGLGDHAV
jgi:hypothetical protein